MKHLILGAFAALLLTGAAHAQVALSIKDGNGATQTILGHNGGGANLWLNQSVCDPTTSNQCAAVDGTNRLSVSIGNTPSVTVTGVSTSANQTAVIGPVAPGSAATNSQLGGCVYNTSAPTPSPSQQVAVQCDHSGNLDVNVANVTGIVSGSTTSGQTGALIMGTVLTAPAALSASTSNFLGMNVNGDLRADQMVTSGSSGSVTTAQAHICGNHVTIGPTTATDTVLVAPVAGKVVYVCDYNFSSNGSNNINLDSATGGACAGATQMDTLWYTAVNTLKTDANPYYRGLATAVGSGVCLKTSAAVAVSFTLYYDQY